MSAPVLNSNANSALISTLSSSDALVNPFEYSLEKMLPFGASYSTDCLPVQGSGQLFSASSVIDFDLPKWGMLRNVCLDFQIVNPTNTVVTDIGAITVIENIELLSSSRRILNITAKDLMCLYSDYPHSQRESVVKKGLNLATVAITSANNTVGKGKHYSINIPFSLLMNHKLNPNLLFQEPQRIRITLSDFFGGGGPEGNSGAGFVAPIVRITSVHNPILKVEYFNPPRELEDKTIQENYSDGSLSVVCYDFHDENVAVGGTGLGVADDYSADNYVECEIKDVGVISDIYFFINLDTSKNSVLPATAALVARPNTNMVASSKTPRPIYRCELSANGQVLFSKNHYEMSIWGRKSDGSNPFAMGGDVASGTYLDNIYKIPLCLSDDKRYPCGGISLRELHNVRLRVWYQSSVVTGSGVNHNIAFSHTGATYTVKPSLNVMLKKYQILTTESASGRVITSVAN